MNKKLTVIISLVCILAFTVLVYTRGFSEKQNQQVNVTTDVSSVVVPIEQVALKIIPQTISATYGDGSASIKEMKKNADSIVTGQVESQKQFSESSIVTTFRVENCYKGLRFDTIDIYQLGALGVEGVLEPGKQYTLFLGLQGEPHENKFYIKGGVQGVFEVQNEKLVIKDSVMTEDFKKVKSNNKTESDIELLIDIINSQD